MNCDKCGTVLKTKDTRQWRDQERGFDWVERRRVCPNCRHIVYTVEIPKIVWDKYELVKEEDDANLPALSSKTSGVQSADS